MAIDWGEMDGSPTESWDSDGRFEAVMRLLVGWNDRYELMARFVNFETPYLHLTEEFGHDGHGVLCRDVSVEPFRAKITGTTFTNLPNRLASYESAVVTIKFGTLRTDQGQRILTTTADPRGRGDVISESIEYNVETMQLDPSLFRWASDNAPLSQDEAPSKRIVGFDYIFRRHNSLTINPEAQRLIDHVNDEPIRPMSPLLRGMVFEKETLHFVKPSYTRTVGAAGQQQIDQVFRFAYRANGWNQFWRGDIDSDDQEDLSQPGGFPVLRKGGWDRIVVPSLTDDLQIVKNPYRNYPLGPIGLL